MVSARLGGDEDDRRSEHGHEGVALVSAQSTMAVGADDFRVGLEHAVDGVSDQLRNFTAGGDALQAALSTHAHCMCERLWRQLLHLACPGDATILEEGMTRLLLRRENPQRSKNM